MAKKSVKFRNQKRIKIAEQYREQRGQLRNDVSNLNIPFEERFEAMKKLQMLPRDSSRCRQRNRCLLCGRPRANNRKTRMCRLHMRILTISGMIPGMHKASW